MQHVKQWMATGSAWDELSQVYSTTPFARIADKLSKVMNGLLEVTNGVKRECATDTRTLLLSDKDCTTSTFAKLKHLPTQAILINDVLGQISILMPQG